MNARNVILVTVFVVALVSVGIGLTSNKFDVSKIPPEKAQHWIIDNEYHEVTWKLGMSKSEVLKIIPAPHNIDNSNVWVWVGNYSSVKSNSADLRWKPLLEEQGGIFLVFTNDHLATGISATAAGYTPWNLLQEFSKMSDSKVEAVLGPEPK